MLSPAYIANVSAFVTLKLRRRNSWSGSIGCGGAQLVDDERGEQREAADHRPGDRDAAPAVAAAARSAPNVMPASPSAHSTAPRTSSLHALARPARRHRAGDEPERRDHQRHVDREDPAPRRGSPRAVRRSAAPRRSPMPPQAVHRPTARPRSAGGNVVAITASPRGREQRAEDALQRPRRRRATRSSAPARTVTDATPKPATPSVKMRFSPNRSPSDPADEDQRAERRAGSCWRSTAARRARRRGPCGSPAARR